MGPPLDSMTNTLHRRLSESFVTHAGQQNQAIRNHEFRKCIFTDRIFTDPESYSKP